MPRGKTHPPEAQDEESQPRPDPLAPNATPARRPTRTMHSLPSDVHDVPTAYKYLRSNGFISEDSEISLPQLALVLLQITQWAKIPTTGTNTIRSVAFILETIEADVLVDSITNKVTAALSPHFTQLREEVEKARDSSASPQPKATPTHPHPTPTPEDWDYVCMSIEELTHKVDESNESLKYVQGTLGNTNAMIDGIAIKLDEAFPYYPNLKDASRVTNEPLLETMKESLDEIKERLTRAGPPPNQAAQPQPHSRPNSYAAAVAGNSLTRAQKEVIARSKARGRQVVIKCNNESTKSLSEKELADKATSALQPNNDHDKRPTFICRNVRKTKGDIILLEMSSKEGAKWLSTHENKNDFTKRLNLDIQILEPAFKTKVEFIPVTLNADDPLCHRDIENASDLPENSISKISWLRRPTERNPDQRVAHVFITFNSPEAANKAIRDGLSIEGKKVTSQQTYSEPMRCFRCQCLQRHLIGNCPETEDTCGTCGKHDHRTPQCKETLTDNFHCVNCKTNKHASWDRSCPSFIREKERLATQNLEHGCKYFPVDNDPSTWPDLANHTNTSGPSMNHGRERQNPQRTPPPPTQPTQNKGNDTWTTIERRRPKKTYTTTQDGPRDKRPTKVHSQLPSQLTMRTENQSILDTFLNQEEETPQRNNTPEPSHATQPDLPPLSPPSSDSPSRPIRNDLDLPNPIQ